MKHKILAILFLLVTACQMVPAQAVRVNNLLFPEDLVKSSDAIIVGHIKNIAYHELEATEAGPSEPAADLDIIVDKVLSGSFTQKTISVSDLTPDKYAPEDGKWQYEWVSRKEDVIFTFEVKPSELMKPTILFLKRGKHWDRLRDRPGSGETWCQMGTQPAKLALFYTALLSKNPLIALKAIRKGDALVDASISEYLQRLNTKRHRGNAFFVHNVH